MRKRIVRSEQSLVKIFGLAGLILSRSLADDRPFYSIATAKNNRRFWRPYC